MRFCYWKYKRNIFCNGNISYKLQVAMLKENKQAFYVYACMKGNEEVNSDLFYIRAWFIKNHLRNISGSNSRNVKTLNELSQRNLKAKTCPNRSE